MVEANRTVTVALARTAFLTVLISGLGFVGAAHAVDKSECNGALTKDIDINSTDHFAALSAYSLMKEADFSSTKSGGGAGADFVIDFVPIKAMANYNEFQTHVHNELTRYDSNSTVSDHRSTYTAHTSDNSLAAYIACLKPLVGVSATPTKVSGDGNSAAVIVTLNIPTDNPHPPGVKAQFVTIDAVVDTSNLNHDSTITLPISTEKTFVVHRQNNASESMVGINAGGYADRTWILWKLPPAAVTPAVQYSTIKCEIQSEPSHAAPPPTDVSTAGIVTCRHLTEAVAPGIIYRFQIHCYDQNGGTQGVGAINEDGKWPTGCVVRPGQG